MIMRLCNKCSRAYPLDTDHFYVTEGNKSSLNLEGFGYRCKDCQMKAVMASRAKKPEKYNKLQRYYSAQYKKNNKESVAEYNKKFRIKCKRDLVDWYVKGIIRNNFGIPNESITDEMVKMKREQIMLYRLWKHQGKKLVDRAKELNII